MIIDSEVGVVVNSSNFKKFKDVKVGDIVMVNPQNLTRGSHTKVNMSCDECESVGYLKWNSYVRNYKDVYKSGEWFCKKCKLRMNNQTKYGVDNIFQLESTKNKTKVSVREKYGVDFISQNSDIKEKIRDTNIRRYGSEYYMSSEDFKNKSIETLSDYGVINISQLDHVKQKKKDNWDGKTTQEKNDIHKKRKKTNIENGNNSGISIMEMEVCDYVKSIYDGMVISSDREVLGGRELDIYLPDDKFAIEFNGLYWHSEKHKPKNYHKEKHDSCRELGINLFQVYEDDWKYRKCIIKSMIFNKLNKTTNRIYARKCEVRIIRDVSIIRVFLNDNHLQGYTSSSIKLGLYYNEELVSLLTFKKVNNSTYNLNRFCNIKYHSIVGGFSKLLRYFTRNNPDISVETFSDNDYSYGELYNNNGFSKMYDLRPDYSYVVGDMREHKFNYRKDKIFRIFENVDMNKSEYELMLENNIYRIYDSGKIKWIKKI